MIYANVILNNNLKIIRTLETLSVDKLPALDKTKDYNIFWIDFEFKNLKTKSHTRAH